MCDFIEYIIIVWPKSTAYFIIVGGGEGTPTTDGHVCSVCGKCFKTKSMLAAHMVYHGDRKFECDDCGKRFYTVAHMNDHKRVHTQEKDYQCQLCGRTFNWKSSLKTHLSRVHSDPNAGPLPERKLVGPHKCMVCGKGFISPSVLRVHMKYHLQDRQYECDMCKKRFYCAAHLREHLRVHTGEKPFRCEVCYKCFTTNANLKTHKRGVHNLEHPKLVKATPQLQSCEVCCKEFVSEHRLTQHMRSHTGEKPYQCDKCGKKLASTSSLSYHITQVHDGGSLEGRVRQRLITPPHRDKRFTCDQCGKKLSQATHLTEHMRVHTGERPYVCDLCSKAFKTKSNMTTHRKKHFQSNVQL